MRHTSCVRRIFIFRQKTFSAVNRYALGRCDDTRGVYRSRSDHPERLPPNQTPPRPIAIKPKTISIDSTLETEIVSGITTRGTRVG